MKKLLLDKRFAIILAAALIRMSFFGFRYFPQLDDYIQYGCYPLMDNVYFTVGLYSQRPLASIFDIFVWGPLWDNMWAVFIIITVMHALSAYFFIVAADNLELPLGLMFAVIFVLCPVNIEASYWISASSRLVVPVFFASLSFVFLSKNKLAPFFILQLISLMFYEQVIVMSVVISFLISLKQKNYKAIILTAVNFVIIAAYYVVFSRSGSYGARAELQLFNFNVINDIISSWNLSFIAGNFMKGLEFCGVWFCFFAVVFCFSFAFDKGHFNKFIFITGILIFISSYAPMVIVKNSFIALRNSFVPLIGLAMAADSLISLTRIKYVFTAFAAMVFIIATPVELDHYRQNFIIDQKIINHVYQNMSYDKPNVITGMRERYVKTNFDFADHVKSVASSDWAITGAVRERAGNFKIPYFLTESEGLEHYNLISLKQYDKIGK